MDGELYRDGFVYKTFRTASSAWLKHLLMPARHQRTWKKAASDWWSALLQLLEQTRTQPQDVGDLFSTNSISGPGRSTDGGLWEESCPHLSILIVSCRIGPKVHHPCKFVTHASSLQCLVACRSSAFVFGSDVRRLGTGDDNDHPAFA